VVAPRCILADRLARAIREQHAVIVPEKRVPHRRLDADARRASRENEMLDSGLLQDRVQLEAAETMLVEHDIGRLRLEGVDDVGAPGITDQHAPILDVRRLDRLPHAEQLRCRTGSGRPALPGPTGRGDTPSGDRQSSCGCAGPP
jgi:hypothetical protein